MSIIEAGLCIFALICFIAALAEFPPPSRISSVRLIALGLFLWLLATLVHSGVR